MSDFGNLEDILGPRKEAFDAARDEQSALQRIFDERYGAGKVRAQLKDDGALLVFVGSGALASRLRMDRVDLIEAVRALPGIEVKELRILSGSVNPW